MARCTAVCTSAVMAPAVGAQHRPATRSSSRVHPSIVAVGEHLDALQDESPTTADDDDVDDPRGGDPCGVDRPCPLGLPVDGEGVPGTEQLQHRIVAVGEHLGRAADPDPCSRFTCHETPHRTAQRVPYQVRHGWIAKGEFRKGGLVFVFVLNVGICLYLFHKIKSY